MQLDKQALLEAAKELGRVVLSGAVVAGVGWFTGLVSTLEPTSAGFIIGTLLVRVADKYVHKSENIKAEGLLPF